VGEKLSEHLEPPTEQEWEAYPKRREYLEQLRVTQLSVFDSSVITLCSGALGLSVALLAALSAIFRPIWFSLLFAAWGIFILTTVLTRISYKTGARTAEAEMENLDAKMSGKKPMAPEWPALVTRWLNRTVIALFPIGALLLLSFAAINAMEAKPLRGSPDIVAQANSGPPADAYGPDKLPQIPKKPSNPNETGFIPSPEPVVRPSPYPSPSSGVGGPSPSKPKKGE
jgi:hypothetical protein